MEFGYLEHIPSHYAQLSTWYYRCGMLSLLEWLRTMHNSVSLIIMTRGLHSKALSPMLERILPSQMHQTSTTLGWWGAGMTKIGITATSQTAVALVQFVDITLRWLWSYGTYIAFPFFVAIVLVHTFCIYYTIIITVALHVLNMHACSYIIPSVSKVELQLCFQIWLWLRALFVKHCQ